MFDLPLTVQVVGYKDFGFDYNYESSAAYELDQNHSYQSVSPFFVFLFAPLTFEQYESALLDNVKEVQNTVLLDSSEEDEKEDLKENRHRVADFFWNEGAASRPSIFVLSFSSVSPFLLGFSYFQPSKFFSSVLL